MSSRTWMIAALLLASACGGKKDDGGGAKAADGNGGGCDRRATDHICSEWHGTAREDWVHTQCDAIKAPYVKACPTDGAVGRCVSDAGLPVEAHTVWYAPATKETVAAMCKPPMELRAP